MNDRMTHHTTSGNALDYPPCPPWCQITDCRTHHYADVAEHEIDQGAAVVEVSVDQAAAWREFPGREPEVRIECQGDLGQPAPCLEPCCLGDRPAYGIHPSADIRLSVPQAVELVKLLTTTGGPAWLIEALGKAVAVFDQDGAQR
jgi:hypothetical protein